MRNEDGKDDGRNGDIGNGIWNGSVVWKVKDGLELPVAIRGGP